MYAISFLIIPQNYTYSKFYKNIYIYSWSCNLENNSILLSFRAKDPNLETGLYQLFPWGRFFSPIKKQIFYNFSITSYLIQEYILDSDAGLRSRIIIVGRWFPNTVLFTSMKTEDDEILLPWLGYILQHSWSFKYGDYLQGFI